MEMSAAKRNAGRVIRELRATALLACNLTRALREELDGQLLAIPTMKVAELNSLHDRAQATLIELRSALGARAETQEYMELVEDMHKHPGEVAWLARHFIDKKLFSNLETAVPRWRLFPPHLRVAIDHHGVMPDGLEWRLLEASLFESAALLWNDALAAATDDAVARGDDKIAGKRFRELKRSAIRAIFALLEGYMNGIACDVSLTVDIAALSKGARQMLLERDDDGRAQFKSFKEKVFGYPRLALGLRQSPVDERNVHLAHIFAQERLLRDAVVHPTPRNDPDRLVLREQAFYEVELDVVRDLLDHSIAAINYIDQILDGKFGRVEIWIAERGADGRFAAGTFH